MSSVAQTDQARTEIRRARAIATTTANAATLTDDGYTFEPFVRASGLWFCRRPEPLIDTTTGEITFGYYLDARAGTCDCPMHEQHGVCKHSIALADHISRILTTATRYQVVEVDPKIGELPGMEFDSADAAWAWVRAEHEGARAAGEPVPYLGVREVTL